MSFHTPFVRWIYGQTPTEQVQLGATVGVIVVVAATIFVINRSGPRLKERYDETIVETGQTLFGGSVVAAGLWLILVVWRALDDVATAVQSQDLGVGRLVATTVVILGAWVLTRLTKRFIKGVARGTSAFSGHQREILHHVVQVTVFLFTILVVLSLWRVDLGNLLLGAGVLGIVLGLAARQTLGAMLAGFVVLFSRPFEVGDWIVVEDTEGVVKDITIVNTRIRTVDGETVMVPNDIITNTKVRNRSRQGRLRIDVEVGVDYDTDLDAALSVAADAMTDVDTVLGAPEPHAVLEEFGDSAIVVGLRFWIDDPTARKYWRARTAVVRAVKDAYEAEEIAIPFPQRELSARPGEERLGAGPVDADTTDADDPTEEAAPSPEDSDGDD